jgi:glycosyltransferase involved in cell wall biosynthesis
VPLDGWDASQDADAASMAQGHDLLNALRKEHSPFHVAVSEIAAREIDAHLQRFDPDVVVVRGSELSAYVPQLRASGVDVVLDSDYAFAAAIATMGAEDANRVRGMTWRHAAKLVARIEAETVGLVDQIWVAHTESRDSLVASYPDAAPIVVIPNVVDVDSYPPSTRAHPEHIVFTGRFDFWPNEDAAATIVRDVLPRLDGATVAIVGMAPTPWMRELDDPCVAVTGLVDDVRPYLVDAGVMAVPLHTGSGTRLKVLEAFAARVPVVSTAKGVEGLHLVDGVHYVRAETAEEFAVAIDALRHDPERADRLVVAAYALVTEQFSLHALEQHARAALTALPTSPAPSSSGSG